MTQKTDLEKIINFPKLSLGSWPTPSTSINIANTFYIKRDDLSGFGRGGIKTRKLEGFMKYLESSGMMYPN